MPVNVGKAPGMIYSDQDQIISFHNSAVTAQDQDLYFFDKSDSETARYQLSASSYLNQRCLHYNIFSAAQVYNHLNHIVLYIKNDVAKPLFQTINVNAFNNYDSFSVCFWSVLNSGETTKVKQSQCQYDASVLGKYSQQNSQQAYVYAYDENKILTFKQNQLQDYQLQDQYKNIFCSATVQMQTFYVSTTNSSSNAQQQQVMLITMPPKVLQQQTDLYPVLDFSIGGGGGGMKQHQHIPYVDGTSYAFAVFHPGTSMPQLSWLSV